MAPVYDFRHVELDKIGRGKRIVKPPGGECSDIFGVQVGGVGLRQVDQSTPRKAKHYMHSNIFSPDTLDSNGHTPVSPPKAVDTQERLFGGGSPDEHTPRRVVNRQRSSIFEDEVCHVDSKPRSTPVRRNPINPITGESVSENGSTPNGSSTHGSPNGSTNGHMNGHLSPESPANGNGFRIRNPPGGKSSGIF